MALIRSIIHMLWMAITVVPYTLAIVLGSLFGMRGTSRTCKGSRRAAIYEHLMTSPTK